ncbi:YheO domain protein [Thermosinus carboxydivorans Nor1]|uniref:YheO domain protein n=1 Tax=Thermosinus carboxydivorans Nor1 TaxID=401526 RepID=A1HSN9_9FIRM|nr:helix-turn-helix transcriptional regulator [Thermosinus carboxydivorans]EAX46920.1 YheO domain protein [Thermosinus carboxydivorans Nor1]
MQPLHPKLQALLPVADAIHATVGVYSEVVIHDVTRPEQSVVYIVGNVTNRQVGAPLTDLVLENLRKYGDDCKDILNYGTTTRDGKTLRSSTTFVRDDDGHIIGCLCINVDLTPMLSWKYFLEKSLAVETGAVKETFSNDVSEALNGIIKSILENYHIPVASLPREEKLNIIKQLDEKGVFLVKGAVDQVAATLGVSRYSIYNYLEEVRSHKIRRN